MIMPFEHISTKWNDDTDAFDEPEQRSGPFRALTSAINPHRSTPSTVQCVRAFSNLSTVRQWQEA